MKRLLGWVSCVVLDWHTPGKLRLGEMVGESRLVGRFLYQVPFRICVYCNEVCDIGTREELFELQRRQV